MDKRKRIDERGDWEKALSSKFQDYEPTIPELAPLILPKRKPVTPNFTWLVSVASIVAIISIAIFYIRRTSTETDIPSSTSHTEFIVAKEMGEGDDLLVLNSKPEVTSQKRDEFDMKNRIVEVISDDNSLNNQSENKDKTTSSAEGAKPNATISERENGNANSACTHPKQPLNETKAILKKTRQPLTMSIFTSSLTLNALDGSPAINGGILAGKKHYEVYETPIMEIGSMILFPINQRLSLQSGLSYSWYRITLKDDKSLVSENHRLEVHSLGIPLSLQYTLFNSKQWRLYDSLDWT